MAYIAEKLVNTIGGVTIAELFAMRALGATCQENDLIIVAEAMGGIPGLAFAEVAGSAKRCTIDDNPMALRNETAAFDDAGKAWISPLQIHDSPTRRALTWKGEAASLIFLGHTEEDFDFRNNIYAWGYKVEMGGVVAVMTANLTRRSFVRQFFDAEHWHRVVEIERIIAFMRRDGGVE